MEEIEGERKVETKKGDQKEETRLMPMGVRFHMG